VGFVIIVRRRFFSLQGKLNGCASECFAEEFFFEKSAGA
jgi:hypothetical protein